MMDAIELGALKWFEGLIWDLEMLSIEAQVGHLPKGSFAEKLMKSEPAWVAGYYLSAMKLRHEALKAGDLSWYCAATYALCQDWVLVRGTIEWNAWAQGSLISNESVRSAVTVVAGMGRLSTDEVSTVCAGNPALREAFATALVLKLLDLKADIYTLGPKAPKPY